MSRVKALLDQINDQREYELTTIDIEYGYYEEREREEME